MKACGERYSGRIKNDDHNAVYILHRFMQAFCIDAEVQDDLTFRCNDCPFQNNDGTCTAKVFKHKFDPDFKNFGAMGDL